MNAKAPVKPQKKRPLCVVPELPSPESLLSKIDRGPLAKAIGRIAAVTGMSVEVAGLSPPVGAVCRVSTSNRQQYLAKVIGFRNQRCILAMLDDAPGLSPGDPVQWLSDGITVGIGPALMGRVLDALGRPMDGLSLPQGLTEVPVDRSPPSSLQRPTIRETLGTGIRVIDSLLTCGVGQRLGIFAGSGVGKSSLLGMLTRGSSADAIVIALVGERGREVREFIEEALGPEGLKRAVLIVATSDQPATLRLQAAWTATAIAESLRDEGKNVLLMIDSVTRFALAQRELGLAAGEPPTTRGYPPSVFAMLPRLVERAGRTEQGSITAFYSVLVEGDDTNEPIADTLRGLLDGHIVLSRKLASQSHWPAVDVLQSLSRLQPQLVSAPLQQGASKVRRWMAEYQANADLVEIGAYRPGSNPELDQALQLRPAIRQFLTQSTHTQHPIAETQKLLLQLAAGQTAGIS